MGGGYRAGRPRAPGFSLVAGGTIFRWVAGPTATSVRLSRVAQVALALAVLSWVPLLVCSVAQGLALGWRGSFFQDVGVHARRLVALPIAIWAERPIARRLDRAVRYLADARLIDDTNRAAASIAIRRAERLRDLRWLEPALAVAALALSAHDLWVGWRGPSTWIFPHEQTGAPVSIAGWLYLGIAAPLFRFVALRWLWRVVLWTVLLAGLARARLRIDPAHPDGTGGLSVLVSAHTSFGWVAGAIGVSLAGNLATERILFARHVTDYWSEIITFSALTPLLFLLPAMVFAWPLERARREFHEGYGSASADFAHRYAAGRIDPETRTPMPVGTPDTSSHTDLVTSFASVEGTRWIPFKRAHYLKLFVPSAVPMVLFLMQEIPLIDLLHRLKDTIG